MAESNNYIDTQQNTEKFQSVVRRKFERFRTKLAELFFTTPLTQPNNKQNSPVNNNSHNNQSIPQQCPDDNHLISNCYYGYTSPTISEEDLRISCRTKNKSKNNSHNKITSTSSSNSSGSSTATSSSACSSSSSMIIEDDSHSTFSNFTSLPQTGELILSQFPVDYDNSHISLPHSLTTGVITLNRSQNQQTQNLDYYSFNSELNSHNSHYDTSSLNTNEEENPFLNKRLTDQIHFNSDINQLSSYFEASLDLIDDQDNFFNIEFMTNYIAYILLKQLHAENKWNLKLTPNQDRNLLIEIAEQIFLESRDEPCGLKGCNISVFVRGEENGDSLVSKFQFGTSRFGAFDIHLFMKQTEHQVQQVSTIATLTRRIFNISSNNNNKANNNAKQYNNDNNRVIYLDSNTYDLFKTNLAYE